MNSRFFKTAQGIVAAVPCFVLAVTLLRTWLDPMSVGNGKWVSFGVGIMVLEFVMVHSGAMMASMQKQEGIKQWKIILMMTGFYALFAGAMALAFKSWSLFGIFTLVMATRWSSFIFDPHHAREDAMRRSGLSAVFYLLAVFATLFIPLPELGMTSSVVNKVYPDRGNGAWEANPEIALAADILYFSLLGISELSLAFKGGARDIDEATG